MKKTARVVVIGGGVTGCSILYHLAKYGWQDVILVERQELTSGSSWHAAGGLFTVTMPNTVAALQKYTFEIYPKLEAESGQSCGFHDTGGLMLCRSQEEMDYMGRMQSAVRRLGIHSEFISLEEAREKAPVLDTSPLVGALWEEEGGHVDPASATQAFAAAARQLGATIYRHNPVIETNPLPNGHWQVVTQDGTIEAEYLVNAAGLWGREVAALAGITLPLMPVEHHYLVTEPVPEIQAMAHELPQINDGDFNGYARQEGQGLLLGAYESHCTHWAETGTPLDFGHELLPDALDRMEWNFAKAVEIMPCLATAGVKRVINGPMIFSPDLGPLLGPHPKLKNYFCANGVMTGFNQGAGIGRVMAEWIMEDEPPFDIFCWDVARYGDWADKAYTKALTGYFYEHRSDRIYPYQEFEVGRPLNTTPAHERLAAANGVFGASFGMEHPLWFAPEGMPPQDNLTFRQPNWWDSVADECRRLRNGVALMEFSAMGKFRVAGPGAQDWLNRVMANKMPERVGRMVLSPMLSEKGRLIGDFSISRVGEEEFFVLGADMMQLAFQRHFDDYLPTPGVSVENLSESLSGLHIAGPAAQELLSKLAEADVSTAAFPFMSAGRLSIAGCEDVIVLRVSFSGECGYEFYCPRGQQLALFDRLADQGKSLNLSLAGTRALMMTRLEKSFPAWGTELSPDYTPFEAGLGPFVALDKEDFVGRSAAQADRQKPLRECRVTLTVDAGDACVWGDEAVFKYGEWVGYVSSGGYGASVEQHIALAYLNPAAVEAGSGYTVEILGEQRPAILHKGPLLDPKGQRMRA
ncbi:MAG: FAD-dependent oxidoreductase [Pseudomonadota bacterium]